MEITAVILGLFLVGCRAPQTEQGALSDSVACSNSLIQQTRVEELLENGADPEEMDLYPENVDTSLNKTPARAININTATREELESIPFFTPEDAENTAYYVYRYGPVKSFRELLLIDRMDDAKLELLQPYIYIGDPDSIPELKHWSFRNAGSGKHELRSTFHQMLEKKDGFKSNQPESARFAGDGNGVAFRYGYNSGNHLFGGVVFEKDPGEKWWNRGPDFSSFHLQIKNVGKARILLIGDYNVRFAEGLICGNAFSLGKSTTGNSNEQNGAAIFRHFSASEYNFFRGLAGTVTLSSDKFRKQTGKSIELSCFLSNRHPDADTTAGKYQTETTSGLHRTKNEMDSKNSLHRLSSGIQLQFRNPVSLVSIQSCCWKTSIRNAPGSQQLPTGSKGFSTSVGIKTRIEQLRIFGELAVDNSLKTALLAGCRLRADRNIIVQLLGRSYHPYYQAIYSGSFSESSTTKNEKGVFASLESMLFRKIRSVFSYDYYYFPVATYYAASASGGSEKSLFLSGYSGKNGEWSVRFRSETKEKNANLDKNPLHLLSEENKKQLRLQCIERRKQWQCRTVFDTNWYAFEGVQKRGFAFATELSLSDPQKQWAVTLHASIFNADNWENRIYIWEKSMPGSFSMPMLYGNGYRNGLFLERSFRHLQFRLSINRQTQPAARESGDNGDRIAGNSRTDLRMQITYRFNSTSAKSSE